MDVPRHDHGMPWHVHGIAMAMAMASHVPWLFFFQPMAWAIDNPSTILGSSMTLYGPTMTVHGPTVDFSWNNHMAHTGYVLDGPWNAHYILRHAGVCTMEAPSMHHGMPWCVPWSCHGDAMTLPYRCHGTCRYLSN